MREFVLKCYRNSVIRYVFFGGCTTMVNLITFYLFRYVFQEPCHGFREHLISGGKFFGARAVTMLLELGGVWHLVEYLQLPDMLGKFLVQFLVLILNYLFSRFFVFTRGKTKS